MTDLDDLRHLSTGYAAAVDALDGEAFAALFTTDGELWVPDASLVAEPTIRRAGSEQLRRIPAGLARYHSTNHRIGATTYELRGDTAVGTVIGEAHHLTASAGTIAGRDGGPGVDTIWYLRYEDEYARESTGWRIARRALHLQSIEERQLDQIGPGR
jgi:SnoaL-like domain